jgi:protease YdgD
LLPAWAIRTISPDLSQEWSPGLRVLVPLLAFVLLAASPLPGIGRDDHRIVVAADATPWTALARLQVPGVARCTAVLVAPQRALTAAHCLWSARLGRYVPPDMIHLLTRYARGGFGMHAVALRARVDRAHDVAVVTFGVPVGTAMLGFAPPPAPGTPVMLGGYNQDRVELIEADTACRVLADDGRRISHDCEGTHGTSGAPLLLRDRHGQWTIAGMEVAAFVPGPGGIAVAAPVLQQSLAAEAAGDAM